jgi:ATP-binding cassette subfamily F protein 3
MTLNFEVADRGSYQVIAIDALRVEVPGRALVDEFTAVLRCNDFVALVGPSGADKSSFISTMLGDRESANRTARIGKSITSAWFRQHLADLPLKKSLFDAIQEQRPLWNRSNVQNHLGAIRFSGDEVRRDIGSLSGGERARCARTYLVVARKRSHPRRTDKPSPRREHRSARRRARRIRRHVAAHQP